MTFFAFEFFFYQVRKKLEETLKNNYFFAIYTLQTMFER